MNLLESQLLSQLTRGVLKAVLLDWQKTGRRKVIIIHMKSLLSHHDWLLPRIRTV